MTHSHTPAPAGETSHVAVSDAMAARTSNPGERREIQFHLDRLNAWLTELWAANNLTLHMCNGTVRTGLHGLLCDIRDDVMAVRDALTSALPHPLPLKEEVERVLEQIAAFPNPPTVSQERARALLSRLRAGAQEGWRLVPEIPTDAMIEAGGDRIVREYAESDWEEAKDVAEALNPVQIYSAMLAAAPSPEEGGPRP